MKLRLAVEDVVVEDNPAAGRFEARLNGQVIGFAEYRRTGNAIAYPHTVVLPAYEGQGVGGKLVHAALEQARAENAQVVPLCSFVDAYIRRHREYQPLVKKD